MFCNIDTWRKEDCAACVLWVDAKTGVGSDQRLDHMAEVFHQQYGISGRGELGWTVRIGVKHDLATYGLIVTTVNHRESGAALRAPACAE